MGRPIEILGRCFNCLRDHRAAACRDSTRCFHCNCSGHKSRFFRRPSPKVARRLVCKNAVSTHDVYNSLLGFGVATRMKTEIYSLRFKMFDTVDFLAHV
uniref:Uncharacterized protein n=1 Tax=Oryza sativa subsp. japonica TaxID=39947 RepID=Q69P76_ORYSJ|nr:hypothetical protein [Oryza sativa Japonica Group]BAD38063.1 hypothetical protein [Oryza sativa Japonica Group]